MARLRADGERLVVRLAWWEKAALRRRNVRVALSAVERVTVQPDWWRLLRGTRGRCLVVPGRLSLGTWRHGEGEDFLALRPEDPAVVCVDLRPPAPFTRIAVSSRHAAETASELESALGRRDGISH
ncbi:hypothetical protein K4749_05195 [Streptomyces sp. TRM72054]|uniref:hypothetical protein n=1 Tax=Streptomyces TaxID=1883 RepID=UPI001487D118|nr:MULTISPECIES: hypothetical protein [Streptomyces]MBX9392993.1 hypothetical protein [Streptomyces sp. TRM72054]